MNDFAQPPVSKNRRSPYVLKVVLVLLIVVIFGLALVLMFLPHNETKPELITDSCSYKDLGEVDAAIIDAIGLSEGEEFDRFDEMIQECKGNKFEYDLLLAKILELDKFAYYSIALSELALISTDKLTEAQLYRYYAAYVTVYNSLGDDEKARLYENFASEAYGKAYGETIYENDK